MFHQKTLHVLAANPCLPTALLPAALPRLQITRVEPLFNQLTIFDGRIPHGVRQVEGTRDPLLGRLVLHGWFTQPSPFFAGGACR